MPQRRYTSGPGAVRQRKEAKPRLYCSDKKCMWSLANGPCPKHPGAATPPPAPVDIEFQNHGSVFLIVPKTDAGREWVAENVQTGLGLGNGLACEPRYVADIIEGAAGAGLVVK